MTSELPPALKFLPPGTRPTDQAVIMVPANKAWSKSCRLFCQYATAEYFKLLQVPKPPDFVPIGGDKYQFADPGRTRTKATGWYRIAYEVRPGNPKPKMTRFRLSSGHTKQTLGWLTDYLNSTGVPWLYLTDGNGARLSRSAFHASW